MDRQTLKAALLQEKKRIDNLLKALEREQKIDTILEEEDEHHKRILYRLPWVYPFEEILQELHEIKQRMEAQQTTCRFTEQESGVMQMLIKPMRVDATSKETGLKEIRDFTYKAKELIVIDPYLQSGDSEENSATQYVKDFEHASRIKNNSLKKLTVIFSSNNGQTKVVKEKLRQLAHDNSCDYKTVDNDTIHDRIWIKDREKAIVVGTSLRGLGNRLCFILPLPDYDVESLLEYLRGQNLI